MPDIVFAPKVFDRTLIRRHLQRRPEQHDDFVTRLVLADLEERLGTVTRDFEQALIMAPDAHVLPRTGRSANGPFSYERVSTVAPVDCLPFVDPEILDLPRRGYDLIVSIFDLDVVDDVPGLGDWYFVPMQRQRETVLDPYEVPADGRPVFITSMVAPIFLHGKCRGVTGVDVAMDEFADPQSAPIEQTLRRGFVFLDDQGRVEYWSARTRELIDRYVGSTAGGRLPASLAGHWRRLREKARGLRPTELPVFRRGASALNIRFIRHPRRGRFVLIVEEQCGTPAPEQALTRREREVYEWIGQGKTNGEIAAILGRSVHTVKRHVERILAKLGVENRCSAALLSAGTLPSPAAEIGHSTYITRAKARV